MNGNDLLVARLSKVKSVTLNDGDLAMQFDRRLDATAGEGMFQQVDIEIRLDGANAEHDLVVSYVVEAPRWKLPALIGLMRMSPCSLVVFTLDICRSP
jgi:hypothetical protein